MTSRRRWTVIAIATILMFLSFSSLLAGLADATEDEASRTAALGVGLAIVPFVFLTLAFGSRHPRAPGAVLRALGTWLVVGISVGWFSFALGLALAFGLGGMITLRADEPGTHRTRAWSLVASITYVFVVAVIVSPAIGLFAAGTVPLLGLGFADQYLEARATRAEGR